MEPIPSAAGSHLSDSESARARETRPSHPFSYTPPKMRVASTPVTVLSAHEEPDYIIHVPVSSDATLFNNDLEAVLHITQWLGPGRAVVWDMLDVPTGTAPMDARALLRDRPEIARRLTRAGLMADMLFWRLKGTPPARLHDASHSLGAFCDAMDKIYVANQRKRIFSVPTSAPSAPQLLNLRPAAGGDAPSVDLGFGARMVLGVVQDTDSVHVCVAEPCMKHAQACMLLMHFLCGVQRALKLEPPTTPEEYATITAVVLQCPAGVLHECLEHTKACFPADQLAGFTMVARELGFAEMCVDLCKTPPHI